MRFLDRIFTRCRRRPTASHLADSTRRRLAPACRELTDAEEQIARDMCLPTPPRLLLIDEEAALIISSKERSSMLQREAGSGKR